MPKDAKPKLYLGVPARLVFLEKEDERAVLDLMRRFSSATRFAYNRLLEGKTRDELKRENGPLCVFFGLNTRYADGAIEKAQAALDSARELGQDPRKVVFGGRKLFEGLKRKHLSGKALLALKREWREKRQGPLYSRGDSTKKGNANLRLESQKGALWLRVNLGNGSHIQALVNPGDGKSPPSAFPPPELSWPPKGPESEPSGLSREPEEVNRRKELPRC
jgi:predicted transposase